MKDNRLVRESSVASGKDDIPPKIRIYIDVSQHFPLEKFIFEGKNS